MPPLETSARRVKFASGRDRVELAGIIDCPTVRPAGGPVAVFSHCFTCNKDFKATVRISRALAAQGVSVLRFDMTGLGGSGGHFAESNFSTNLNDLAAAIRFADTELGPVTALLGHSFGGLAALVTASRANSGDPSLPLEDLGFVGTLAAPSDTLHLASLLLKLAPSLETEGVGSVTIGGISWEIKRQMVEDFRGQRVTDELPKIACPVLLMHSPEDQTVAFDHALRLMSLIQQSGPRIQPVSLVSLDGADHLLVKNSRDLDFASSVLAAWCERYA
ncbi:MAG: alpha/beta fold hydrolase [Planctomycetota bacterium]